MCVLRLIVSGTSILLYEGCPQKFDKFLAGRSQFDSDNGVDFYAPTCFQSATVVLPFFAFYCLLFLKKNNNK